MIALACHALFASGGILAVGTIAATILPQADRIVRILCHGPEWSVHHG